MELKYDKNCNKMNRFRGVLLISRRFNKINEIII